MDRPYHDNPFEPSNHSDVDLSSHPPPSRLNSIPLGNVGSSSNPSTPYQPIGGYNQPFSAESTDDLATPTAANFSDSQPRGSPFTSGAGYGMASDMSRAGSNFNDGGDFINGSHEPKLGAYSPGSRWMQPQPPKSNRKKWIVMGALVAIVGAIIIAVVIGVVVSNNKKNNSKNLSTTSNSASSTGPSANATVQQTDPNDPSQFTKDPNLHQSFYGLAYTPVGSQLPDCGNTLAAVIQDIQIMSQLTPRVRLYGADCNQSALVLEAIKQTKVNMTVYLGNYPVPTDNGTAYTRQRNEIQLALQTYGADHIGGITVGNEFMLNYVTQNGISDVNSPAANVGADILLANIQDTQSMLQSMNLNIPIGNADAGSFFSNELLAAVNYGMANVHPWFANVSVDQSAGWTADFFSQTDVFLANSLPNKPTMYIAETGWPTKSSDAGNANNGASTASIPNLQVFLDTFICQANTNGTGYFFFEFADESWKDQEFGGVEGWWGLFNQDRTLKSGITVPNCQTS